MLVLILVVILFARVEHLTRRLERLEEVQLDSSLRRTELSEVAESAKPLRAPSPAPSSQTSPKSDTDNIAPEESAWEHIKHWLVVDWPMKAGAALLVIAAGWFVTYAFVNDWIGPTGRVVLGISAGILALLFGAGRVKVSTTQGNVLMVLGVGTILLSLLAGVTVYEVFPVPFALLVMFGAVVFVALQALVQNNLGLAALMLFLGAALPVFVISRTTIDIIFLYLFALSAGTVWLTIRKNTWRVLNLTALAIVGVYSTMYGAFEGFDRTVWNLLFAAMFAALFYLAGLQAVVLSRRIEFSDIVVPGGLAFLWWFWVSSIAAENWQTFLILLGALFFAGGAYFVFRKIRFAWPGVVYTAAAFGLVLVALARELEGAVFFTALTVQFGALSLALLYLPVCRSWVHARAVSVFALAVPVLYGLQPAWDILRAIKRGSLSVGIRSDIYDPAHFLEYYYSRGAINLSNILPELFPFIILCFLGVLSAVLCFNNFKAVADERAGQDYLALSRIFISVSGFYALFLIWVLFHILIKDDNLATFATLIIYTLFGLFFYVAGVRNRRRFYRLAGGSLFAIVLLRLFLVEFWEMSILAKTATFFAVGILLLSTAFLARMSTTDTEQNLQESKE